MERLGWTRAEGCINCQFQPMRALDWWKLTNKKKLTQKKLDYLYRIWKLQSARLGPRLGRMVKTQLITIFQSKHFYQLLYSLDSLGKSGLKYFKNKISRTCWQVTMTSPAHEESLFWDLLALVKSFNNILSFSLVLSFQRGAKQFVSRWEFDNLKRNMWVDVSIQKLCKCWKKWPIIVYFSSLKLRSVTLSIEVAIGKYALTAK